MNVETRLVPRRRTPRPIDIEAQIAVVQEIAPLQYALSAEQSQRLINAVIAIFNHACRAADVDERALRAITTKFRDAGRRSAPWQPASSRVPGRPQDGSDGNRINRWLMASDHKYYAPQEVATLVEVKYFLQALSMEGAPATPAAEALALFHPWLIEHPVSAGAYVDPVQLIPISFDEFVKDRRLVQSGHLRPLDRGGKHHPSNTFLMLARSNQLQGNLKVSELLELMSSIVAKHAERKAEGDELESRIEEQS